MVIFVGCVEGLLKVEKTYYHEADYIALWRQMNRFFKERVAKERTGKAVNERQTRVKTSTAQDPNNY